MTRAFHLFLLLALAISFCSCAALAHAPKVDAATVASVHVVMADDHCDPKKARPKQHSESGMDDCDTCGDEPSALKPFKIWPAAILQIPDVIAVKADVQTSAPAMPRHRERAPPNTPTVLKDSLLI